MASRTIRPRPRPRRTEAARPSTFAVLVNWLVTIFAVGFLCTMLYLMWPMIAARLSGVPTLPLATEQSTGNAPLPTQRPNRTNDHSSSSGGGGSVGGGGDSGGNLSIGNYNATSAAQLATAVIATTAITPTDTPAPECRLMTWADGSQGCDDGRAISPEQSRPGYCVPVVWDDGSVGCNDGKPAGTVVWPDPDPAPTNTPWPAAPTGGVTWAANDGPNGNTCVTVTFPDQHTQTACSEPNVKLSSETAAFTARLIEDGKLAPGNGTPKG